MKKIILLSFGIGLFSLTSCESKKNETDSLNKSEEVITKEDHEVVGGQKDEHGCLASAGETWSELKNSCIQVFNVGIRLNPTNIAKDDAVISAFIVYSDDKSKLELFLPDDGGHHAILDKTGEETYQDKTYLYNVKESALYIDGTKKFEAEK